MLCSPLSTDHADVCEGAITERIRAKIADYERYRFTSMQSCALNIFFDLAQEYEEVRYLYHLPVKVLYHFFSLKAELYVLESKDTFVLRTSRVNDADAVLPSVEALQRGPVQEGNIWFFPAKGRPGQSHCVQTEHEGPLLPCDDFTLLAVLVIYPETPLSEHDSLYYAKFANRLGFSLHNRQLAQKNQEYIRFVRNLVHDIGHNVIAPNLYFKLLMRQMEGKIAALGSMAQELAPAANPVQVQSLAHLHERMAEQYQEMSRHFQQSSFFLETLLRQSHFEQGQYVLHKIGLDLIKRVIAPQLERYHVRFQEKNIVISESYPPESLQPVMVEADMGLLSQVMANLFSNALKYTRATPGIPGLRLHCAVDVEPGGFGPGQDAVQITITTSGPIIAEDEIPLLFVENFRASNTDGEYGTGHGLHFIQLIMDQHGGCAGYSRNEWGNSFHLTIPRLQGESLL